MLYKGIASLGENFAKAVEERKKREEEERLTNTIVTSAHANGDIGQEDLDKFSQMSAKQKKDYAFGLAATIHDKWQRRAQQSELAAQAARTAALKQQMQEANYVPSWEDQQRARATGNELLPMGKGRYAPVPYPDPAKTSADFKVEKFVDPNTGKPVPGLSIVHGPGNQFQVVATPGEGPAVETDPQTGIQFYRGPKGERKPLSAQQALTGPLNKATAGDGAAGGATAAPTDKVRVISPQGVPGFVPKDRLKAYLDAGYTQG